MDFSIAFDFLKKLRKNNDRDWFEKNKDKFLSIKHSFEAFIGELYDQACLFDPSLEGQDPRKLVFRIYRDVRFSKDKKPYKEFLSAGISSKGKGTGVPGYYLQFEPGDKSFVCVGLFAPASEILGKVRQEIDYNGEELEKIMADKNFKKNYEGFWDGDSLKTAPKGYVKDHPYIEWLRLRHYVIMRSLTDHEVLDKKFMANLVKIMKAGKPFNDFIKHALE
jgi:uncharacterized protein (TIGR02453 family)